MTVIELFLYANSTNIISFERSQKIISYKRFIHVKGRTICDPDCILDFKYCHFKPPNLGPRNYQAIVVFVIKFRKIELNSVIAPILFHDFRVIFDSK